MPDVLEPPPTPSGVSIVEGPAPKAPPPPTKTIRVSQMPTSVEPHKPTPGQNRIRKSLEQIAKPFEGQDDQPPAPPAKPAAKPSEKPATAQVPDEAPTPDPNEPPAPATAQPTAEPGKKVSPWKLYEAEKTARAAVEKQLQDMKASIVPEAERKTLTERMTATEKRNAELEEHIRFVDYQKSSEFQAKYQQPYQAAWKRALSELGELTLTDPNTQQPRRLVADDILQLVNLPLQQAREIADATFGVFATDVMAHRKEIRSLFDQQAAALDEAKKNGVTHWKQAQEQFQRNAAEMAEQIQQTWTKVNEDALADPKMAEYFKPKEGNEEWNQRLSKGYALADRAYKEDPRAPNLTPEQRISAIKRHAAVRNRAAGWGPLKWENGQLKKAIKELESDLAKYKGSTPTAGGTSTPQNGTPASPWARLRGDLAKLARPGS
jgi:hypothetical protein